MEQAVAHDYDGVDVDFETGLPGDRAAYTSFVTDLAARLHAIGKKLAVDVSAKTADDPTHPRSGLYDYPAVAAAADVVFVMAWGIRWTTSEPGPNTEDMAWLRAVVHYVNTLPDREKYVMGTPLYGLDWPRPAGPGAPARALEWSDIAALSARVGVPAAYDALAHEAHFSYVAADGRIAPRGMGVERGRRARADAPVPRQRVRRRGLAAGPGGPGAVGGPGGGGVGTGWPGAAGAVVTNGVIGPLTDHSVAR